MQYTERKGKYAQSAQRPSGPRHVIGLWRGAIQWYDNDDTYMGGGGAPDNDDSCMTS